MQPPTISPTKRDQARQPVYEIARSKQQLVQAFELAHAAYCRTGIGVDHPSRMRLTPYHLLSTSEVMVARIEQTIFSTISLFGDGELGLPMVSMYKSKIDELRNSGVRLAELGSLADRREPRQARYIDTLASLGRLIAQAAAEQNIDALVAVVHPKHARLYKRILGFKQIGDCFACPYAKGAPGVPVCLEFNDHVGTKLHYQYFGISIPSEQLAPYVWESETRNYFQRVFKQDTQIASTIDLEDYYDFGVPANRPPAIDLRIRLGSPSEHI